MFDLGLASKTPGEVAPLGTRPRRQPQLIPSPSLNPVAVLLDLSGRAEAGTPNSDLVASWRHAAAAGRLWRAEIEKAAEDARRLIGFLVDQGDPVAARVTDADIDELRRSLMESFRQEPVFRLVQTSVALRIENVTISLRHGAESVELSVSRVTLQASWSELTIFGGEEEVVDPLVIDLAGDGVRLAPMARRFDLDGDGAEETVTWVQGDDGLLALDRDGDGRITSGKELFGDQHGAVDGFAELAKFDDDGNGVIDAHDSVWRSLLVVRERGDPVALEELGVTSLRFDVVRALDQDVQGGRLVSAGTYTTRSGQVGSVVDALFDVSA